MFRKILIALSLLILVSLLLIAGFFIFKPNIINYLSVNKPIDAEYLVVEGWVSDHTLDYAISEFNTNSYEKIIVTGVKISPDYLMSVDGFFEFGFPGTNLLLEEGDSIKVKLKGTDINGIFAEFSLFFNGDKIGSGKTSSNWEEFLYIADTSYLLKKVTVSFDNDAIFGKLDRNLYVGPLSINDSLIPARSENNRYYDKYNPEKQEGFPVNFRSVAGLAANSLLEKGISEEKVIVLPSEISDKNRTYNSALAVREWFEEQSPENISFNLVSENIHARRSWILFRYALKGMEAEVGIITENASNDRNQNLKINNENLIREIIGNLYYRTFFRL